MNNEAHEWSLNIMFIQVKKKKKNFSLLTMNRLNLSVNKDLSISEISGQNPSRHLMKVSSPVRWPKVATVVLPNLSGSNQISVA